MSSTFTFFVHFNLLFLASFSKTCDITTYGAVADGKTDNVKAIQSAIADCGSTNSDSLNQVLLPQSGDNIYVSSALWLESNIDFHFEDGVTLLGSPVKNTSAYPMIYTRREGTMVMTFASLLNGGNCTNITYNSSALGDQCQVWKKLENVKISGRGTIDGNGDSGWYDSSNSYVYDNRPCLLQLMWINNLQIYNVTLTNPPFWTLHPLFSDNIIIANLTIKTTGPNTDGIDPDSCSNVVIHSSYVSTGDDCIAIKSGKDEDGRLVGIPTNNVSVYDMSFGDGHGISIGSEMSGNVTNVYFKDLVLDHTDRGVRIKSQRGRGGQVSNITYDTMSVSNVEEAISISEYYNSGATGVPPIFRDIYIYNVTGTVTSQAGEFDCLPEMPCHNIVLDNVNITKYPKGFDCEYAYGTSINVSPKSCLMSE